MSTRPNMRDRPNGMHGMLYCRELTKLCAYGFYVYGFGYFRFKKEGPGLIVVHPLMFLHHDDFVILL